jgi:hypothetical protein
MVWEVCYKYGGYLFWRCSCYFHGSRFCCHSLSMAWRFSPKTGLNLAHKFMLLVFVATAEKLILARDNITPVAGSAPFHDNHRYLCTKDSQSVATKPQRWSELNFMKLWQQVLSLHLQITWQWQGSFPVQLWRLLADRTVEILNYSAVIRSSINLCLCLSVN